MHIIIEVDNITSLIILKWQEILCYILNSNKVPLTSTRLRKDVNITYTYLFHTLAELEDKGFINLVKEGRVNYIYLTDKGVKLATACRDMVNGLRW